MELPLGLLASVALALLTLGMAAEPDSKYDVFVNNSVVVFGDAAIAIFAGGPDA